ncbi:MAG: DEAD/DEAH box helicase [Planctomycetes bacterium]|nr:DEAD/DEAH box helicase [Planctomycetota bacterium]
MHPTYLDPLLATARIRDSYLRYLASTFVLRDDALRARVEETLAEPGRLIRGPLLEATPPYRKAAPVASLVREGVLHREFLRGNREALDPERALYSHQERGIRRVVAEKRNLVAATGTGSGKTETFLIPILDHLHREHEAGTLGKGVRALLLYPMNALAHDQLKRLRRLTDAYPYITFGRYVGDTKHDERSARATFNQLFPKETHREQELISRARIQETPPHILLTNYAMLEYLLLRPGDSPLFEPVDGACTWRFLVLDEAHTYDGTQGAEVAYLLRRLKDRLVRSEQGRLRCVATSATIGGRDAAQAVATFAQNLFSEPFDASDVVFADREPVHATPDDSLGVGSPAMYAELLQSLDRAYATPDAAVGAVQAIVERYQGAESPWVGALRAAPTRRDNARTPPGENLKARPVAKDAWDEHASGAVEVAATDESIDQIRAAQNVALYECLRRDRRLRRLRERLEPTDGSAPQPVALDVVAQEIFSDAPQGREQALVALVQLAVRAKTSSENAPLLPARYHLFVRAVSGIKVCLADHAQFALPKGPRVFFDDRVSCDACPSPSVVFDLSSCRRCGQGFIVGNAEHGHLTPISDDIEEREARSYFMLGATDAVEADPDEDESESPPAPATPPASSPKKRSAPRKGKAKLVPVRLCLGCGRFDELVAPGLPCGCGPDQAVELGHWRAERVTSCPACGASRGGGDLITPMITSQDAPVAVLATALFPTIPAAAKAEERERAGEGRKLLTFADSRQDAAYFAAFVEDSYERMLFRHLAIDELRKMPGARDREAGFDDVAKHIALRAREIRAGDPKDTRTELKTRAMRWLMREFVGLDVRHSLEACALLSYRIRFPADYVTPRPLQVPPFGFTSAEADLLVEMLLDSVRRQGAVVLPDVLTFDDPAFEPRNAERMLRESGPDARNHILSFRPTESPFRRNARYDLLDRVLLRIGVVPDQAREHALKAIERLWRDWIVKYELVDASGGSARSGVLYRLHHRDWRLVPTEAGDPWFRCDSCGRVTNKNLRSVCPGYGCPGTLQSIDSVADARLRQDHYRALFESMPAVSLRAQEHTAQLVREEATQVQSDFIDGKFNLLSCSTTFELGVDVGELESVLLRNVPPSAANYVQRAGRAGRRTGSAALVVTFAQRRSHDLSFFTDPARMIAGVIRPPRIDLLNEHIGRRHVHSIVLSEYFRLEPSTCGSVKDMFDVRDANGVLGVDRFEAWLRTQPRHVAEQLARVVPIAIHGRLGVGCGSWRDELLDAGRRGSMGRARIRIEGDLSAYADLRAAALADGRGAQADQFKRIRATYAGRDLLGELSGHLVLPGYTFPKDAVELELETSGEDAGKVQLARDLSLAIGDYAPGSQVVARKKLWESTGIRRVPKRDFERFNYVRCPCGWFDMRKYGEAFNRERTCPHCQRKTKGGNLPFIRPEFGFFSHSPTARRPGSSRPKKLYATRVYYKGLEREEPAPQDLRGPSNELVAKVTVATDAELVVLNEGRGGDGFECCTVCGWARSMDRAVPANHRNRWGRPCGGWIERFHLGHVYKTDVALLRFADVPRMPESERESFWWSLCDAVLEGMAAHCEIPIGEVNATLNPATGGTAIVLFDTVPGGAGHVRNMHERPLGILKRSLERVIDCACDPATSCYECLREYRNQYRHRQLVRGPAALFLLKVMAALTPERAIELVLNQPRRFVARVIDGASQVSIHTSGQGNVLARDPMVERSLRRRNGNEVHVSTSGTHAVGVGAIIEVVPGAPGSAIQIELGEGACVGHGSSLVKVTLK